jgi:hypothetical protein
MEQRFPSVATAMPHAARRLVWLAAILGGFVVAGVVIYVATRSGNSSAQHQQTSRAGAASSVKKQARNHYGTWNLGIAYGWTPKQVLRQIGAPVKKQANCWLYRGQVRGGIGNIRGRFSGLYVDAIKFCFGEGPAGGEAMTQIRSHYAAHTIFKKDATGHVVSKRFYSAEWNGPVTLMKVPDWYLQETS